VEEEEEKGESLPEGKKPTEVGEVRMLGVQTTTVDCASDDCWVGGRYPVVEKPRVAARGVLVAHLVCCGRVVRAAPGVGHGLGRHGVGHPGVGHPGVGHPGVASHGVDHHGVGQANNIGHIGHVCHHVRSDGRVGAHASFAVGVYLGGRVGAGVLTRPVASKAVRPHLLLLQRIFPCLM
jgi:hypothetical protein